MKVKVLVFIIFYPLICLICIGCCDQTVYLYPDRELPSNKAACLELASSNTEIKINGEYVEYVHYAQLNWPCNDPLAGRVRIKMPPGKYKIEWAFKFPSTTYERANLTFKGNGILDAKPGKAYQVVYSYLYCDCNPLPVDFHIVGNYEFRTSEVTIYDYATWIEEQGIFGSPWRTGIVAAGKRPEWMKTHVCARCGQKKAPPRKYHCEDCAQELKMERYERRLKILQQWQSER